MEAPPKLRQSLNDRAPAGANGQADFHAGELRLTEDMARMMRCCASAPIAMLLLDDQGRCLYMNPRAQALARVHDEQHAGFGWTDWIDSADRARVLNDLRRAKGAIDEVTTEFHAHMNGDPTRWIALRTASLGTATDGTPLRIGIAEDITDRKQAEEDAQRRQEELLHVSRVSTLGKMASEIAHELNQPLSAIINYASGCERRIATEAREPMELLPAIEEMRAEAERAGQIIRRISAFVRKQSPPREAADVNLIVRDALALAGISTQQHHVAIDLGLADDLPHVEVDRIQITQVLVNLVRNAMEAMLASATPSPTVTVDTRRADDGFVEVAVRDVGPGLVGISNEQLFESFVSTKPDGLGLGLSISRSIIEAHGGRICVAPNSDRGITFRFTLPSAEEEH